MDVGRKAEHRQGELYWATSGVCDGEAKGVSATQLFTCRRPAREGKRTDGEPALTRVENHVSDGTRIDKRTAANLFGATVESWRSDLWGRVQHLCGP